MSPVAAGWIVAALEFYAGLGLLFAVVFVVTGVDRIDSVARRSGWGFRLMILPGSVALWPLLLRRWIRSQPPPLERNPHRLAASVRPGGPLSGSAPAAPRASGAGASSGTPGPAPAPPSELLR